MRRLFATVAGEIGAAGVCLSAGRTEDDSRGSGIHGDSNRDFEHLSRRVPTSSTRMHSAPAQPHHASPDNTARRPPCDIHWIQPSTTYLVDLLSAPLRRPLPPPLLGPLSQIKHLVGTCWNIRWTDRIPGLSQFKREGAAIRPRHDYYEVCLGRGHQQYLWTIPFWLRILSNGRENLFVALASHRFMDWDRLIQLLKPPAERCH